MGKALSFKVNNTEEIEIIEKHIKKQGFKNINSYLKYLVNEDLKKVNTNMSNNTASTQRILIEGMLDRLSDEQTEKVIDYIKLLLK